MALKLQVSPLRKGLKTGHPLDYYLSPTGDDGASGDAQHPWLTPARAAQEIARYSRFVAGSIFRVHLTGGGSFQWSALQGIRIDPTATLAVIGEGDTVVASGALSAGTTNPAFGSDAQLVTAGGFGVNTWQGFTLLLTSGAGAGLRLRIREHTDTTFIPCSNLYATGYSLSPGDAFQIIKPANTIEFGNDGGAALNSVGDSADTQSEVPGVFWFVNCMMGGAFLWFQNSRVRTVGCQDVSADYETYVYGGMLESGFALYDVPEEQLLQAEQLGAPTDTGFAGRRNIRWACWLAMSGSLIGNERLAANVRLAGVIGQATIAGLQSILSMGSGVLLKQATAYASQIYLSDSFDHFVIAGSAPTAYSQVCSILCVVAALVRLGNRVVFAQHSGVGIYATGIDSRVIFNGSAPMKPSGSCGAYSIRIQDGASFQSEAPWAVTGGTNDVLIDGVAYSNAAIDAAGGYVVGVRGSRWIQGGG